MGFSCFKRPAVQEDFAPVGNAPAASNGLPHVSPLPEKPGRNRSLRDGRGSMDKGDGKLSTPRSSIAQIKLMMRRSLDGKDLPAATAPTTQTLPGQGSGPWHAVDNPVKWTGPPVPSAGPAEAEEPFMIAQAKTVFHGFPLFPWEGEEWTGPQMLEVVQAALRDLRMDPKKGMPDTHKLSSAQAMVHMRWACADILPTPLFAFLLRLFEGPEMDLGQACDQFLTRILKGCKDSVYCSIAHPIPKAYDEVSDSRLTGAALFLRLFLLRFAKRFPPQHGFVNPTVDDAAVRSKLVEDVGDGFQSWEFMRATVDHPAAIVIRLNNKGLKAMNAVAQPNSWRAINHFYEFAITEPSVELSGHPSIFIIDLGKVSMGQYNKTNITAAAAQLQAAMFHPEPFSAFVVAHAPSIFQFGFSIAKFFLTESARDKFIILNGSASAHFHKNMGIPLEKLPVAVGGTSTTETLLSVRELLSLTTQQRAVDAHFRITGGGGGGAGGAMGHRPDGGGVGGALTRVGDSATGELMLGTTPSTSEGAAEVEFGRSNTMGEVVTLQGKLAELKGKLDEALSSKQGGEGGRQGPAVKAVMMAQTWLMTLLIFLLTVLVMLLIKRGGSFYHVDGMSTGTH